MAGWSGAVRNRDVSLTGDRDPCIGAFLPGHTNSDLMIKLIVLIKRNAAMSPAEFHRYWRTEHAKKVNAIAATKKYVRRYVQAHTRDAEYTTGEPAFDGTAELWFDSLADKDAFYADAQYLAEVNPDERVFADMQRTQFIVTEEETVI
jgi:uncharacterized protein (TIGR02118 family)